MEWLLGSSFLSLFLLCLWASPVAKKNYNADILGAEVVKIKAGGRTGRGRGNLLGKEVCTAIWCLTEEQEGILLGEEKEVCTGPSYLTLPYYLRITVAIKKIYWLFLRKSSVVLSLANKITERERKYYREKRRRFVQGCPPNNALLSTNYCCDKEYISCFYVRVALYSL